MFKLIDYFTLNANHVLTKDQIIENVWGIDEYLDDNTIAVLWIDIHDMITCLELLIHKIMLAA